MSDDDRRAGTRTASGRRGSAVTMPAKTTPAPPPIPSREETRPIAPGTRSLGNSSRMIENASGKMPPPAPWITRPRIISHRRRGDRGDQRAEREHQQHDHQQALLAVHVAEPADDRRRHRGAQQIGGQHPADRALGGVERALDLRQRRDHQRLQERVGDAAERQDGEDDPGARAGGALQDRNDPSRSLVATKVGTW